LSISGRQEKERQMRFERIKILNFLSHIKTEVRFQGYDAVVVVGPNGAGKSSLMVDAPLVALFGRGRSGDLDGYIRNGTDVLTVEFDFSLGADLYRVVRKRSRKTTRGTSSLDFYQIDNNGNVVHPLTAGSIGETESLIRKTIGSDFETLVRSSIIEQGEADFFCNASPSERMELFSKIWDLEKYEEFAQMAREIAREAKERIKLIEERVMGNNQKIWEIEKNAEEIGKLKSLLEKEAMFAKGAERKKEDLQKKIGTFESMTREIEKAKVYQAQADKDLKVIGGQHDEVIKKIERYSKILKNRDVVVQKVEEEKRVNAEIEKIEAAVKDLNNWIDDARVEEGTLRRTNQTKIDRIDALKKEIDSKIDGVRQRLAEANKELSKVGRKEEQLRQMCLDADKLKGVQCHPDYDPSYVNETCRFIRDAVTAKRRIPELQKEITDEEEVAKEAIANADLDMAALNKEKAQSNENIAVLRNELEGELEKVEAKIAGILKERGTNEAMIQEKKKALEEIKRYTKLLPEISLAEQELPKLVEEEKRLANRCKEVLEEVDRSKKEVEKLGRSLEGKADLEKELQSVCNELKQVMERKDELTRKIGFVEAGLAQIEELKRQCANDEAEIEGLEGNRAIYQMLEDAFRQIPYMLVARGIGAVENITNEILSMVSSSGLRVMIKTEKETKTTKRVRDEIHLVIQDADGEKQYKFLSGGEKLRVALALRLAIGEVFAHRRGVSIESLLADEPFGPLDVEGIEDMKEAMRELKKRFKFMGVITHIERAMDIFPTKLVFEKNGNKGTHVAVSDE
jgi:exonuclease SbcC